MARLGPRASPESSVAFYKAVKFWLVLLLALVLAAVLWRLWAGEGAEPRAQACSPAPAAARHAPGCA